MPLYLRISLTLVLRFLFNRLFCSSYNKLLPIVTHVRMVFRHKSSLGQTHHTLRRPNRAGITYEDTRSSVMSEHVKQPAILVKQEKAS